MNNQKPTKLSKNGPHLLDVHSIFHTIQGEGPFSGTPAIFIRLSGCNLQCRFCDTEYTKSKPMGIGDIIMDAILIRGKSPTKLVVITGGEPFRQDLSVLTSDLVHSGFYVQIETNGSLKPIGNDLRYISRSTHERLGIHIVCSPKTKKISKYIRENACAFKYVIDSKSLDLETRLPLTVLGNGFLTDTKIPKDVPVYVQPMDIEFPKWRDDNMAACVELSKRYGFIVQLQIHKLLHLE